MQRGHKPAAKICHSAENRVCGGPTQRLRGVGLRGNTRQAMASSVVSDDSARTPFDRHVQSHWTHAMSARLALPLRHFRHCVCNLMATHGRCLAYRMNSFTIKCCFESAAHYAMLNTPFHISPIAAGLYDAGGRFCAEVADHADCPSIESQDSQVKRFEFSLSPVHHLCSR